MTSRFTMGENYTHSVPARRLSLDELRGKTIRPVADAGLPCSSCLASDIAKLKKPVKDRDMNRFGLKWLRVSLAVIGIVGGVGSEGNATVSLSASPIFRDLDPGMPPSFELGQTVNTEVELADSVVGERFGREIYYREVVRFLSVEIPEANFNFDGTASGNAIRRASGNLVFTIRPTEPLAFDGLEFNRAMLEFSPPAGDVSDDPWERLDEYVYSSFRLYFSDPATGRIWSGARSSMVTITADLRELPSIPEPAFSSLFLSVCLVTVLVARRWWRSR